MCGRYQLNVNLEDLLERYFINMTEIQLTAREEIFPSQKVPVVINEGENQLKLFKWGFAPSFSKRDIINARGETVASKPTFRESFQKRRCLIPATAFFEWQNAGNKKIKYRIQLKSEEIFSLAGIYNTFNNNGNHEESFTIITTSAPGKVANIHDRVPVIISREVEREWLNNNYQDIDEIKNYLNTLPAEEFVFDTEKNKNLTQKKFDF